MKNEKNDVIKTFNLSKSTNEKLTQYAKERSVSKSAVLRILINTYCKPLDGSSNFGG